MKQSNKTFEIEGVKGELLVSFEQEKTDGYYEETGNPSTWIAPTVYTELLSVEVVIAGIGIDILPQLTDKQKLAIIQELDND